MDKEEEEDEEEEEEEGLGIGIWILDPVCCLVFFFHFKKWVFVILLALEN